MRRDSFYFGALSLLHVLKLRIMAVLDDRIIG
jgi:hypothetical protein